jgi:hypothetical protein
VTIFRLSAGRGGHPPQAGGRPPAASRDEEVTRVRDFVPAREPLTPLDCGCKIPWPLFTLIGSGEARGKSGRQIHCDEHGWQHVTNTTITAAKRRARKNRDVPGQEELPPF